MSAEQQQCKTDAKSAPVSVIRFQDAVLRRYFGQELLPQTRARAAALRALVGSLEYQLARIDPNGDLHQLDALVLAVDAIEAAASDWVLSISDGLSGGGCVADQAGFGFCQPNL